MRNGTIYIVLNYWTFKKGFTSSHYDTGKDISILSSFSNGNYASTVKGTNIGKINSGDTNILLFELFWQLGQLQAVRLGVFCLKDRVEMLPEWVMVDALGEISYSCRREREEPACTELGFSVLSFVMIHFWGSFGSCWKCRFPIKNFFCENLTSVCAIQTYERRWSPPLQVAFTISL